MKDLFTTALATLALAAFTITGCADSSDTSQFNEVSPNESEHADHDAHAGHAHPTHGPHGGDLIELGNEEYHAELVHPHGHEEAAHQDEAEHESGGEKKAEAGDHDHDADEHAGITVYILDGAAKKAVAIEATEIMLNLSHDGQPEQFKLAAMPETDDPAGKSSRFASSEKDLLEHFHEAEHVEGALVLSIDGKAYRGKLAHNHGDEHDHAHDDHKSEHTH
ncbi:MAG: hypothetical protein HQ518_07965 [Rhodopirellula sp.]|nr:hypothetical protein [Rhodopirellula sp.]